MSENEGKIISTEEIKATPQRTNQPKTNNASNKNGGLNALLFIGSLLIVVGSCSLLMSAVSNLMKLVILLAITVLFYIAGLLIRKVKVLIPAGTAFTCTSLAVMPFLGFAFSEFTSVSPEISWLLTSTIGTVAYIAAALIIKSRVIAFFSMGFVVSLFCSMPANLHMATLWNYLSVISVSIFANLISIIFKNKVPTAYRDILTHTARWLAVAVAVATVFGVFSLSGFDYSIIFAICLAQFVLSFLTTKDYTDEVLARLVAVPLILSLFWEIFPANSSEFAIVAGLVCLAEIAYSFFSSLLRPSEKDREIPFVIIFLVSSLFCPLFAAFKPDVTISPNLLGVAIVSIDFIFTILFAAFWKNKAWLVASYFFAVILPLYIETGENKAKITLIIYAFEFICFSIYYYFQKSQNRALENFNLVAYSVLLVITRMASSPGGLNYLYVMNTQAETVIFNVIALAVPAFAWLVFGLKDENKNRIETSIYFFITCLGSTILQLVIPYADSEINEILTSLILSSTFLLGLGLASLYRKNYARAIVATSIFSYFAIMTVASIYDPPIYYSWMEPKSEFVKNSELFIKLAFLCEEIFIAIIGAVKHKKALFWIATPVAALITLKLTEGMVWFWLILIGLGLIAFVIWKLLKTQQKQLPTPNSPKPNLNKPQEPPKTPTTPSNG